MGPLVPAEPSRGLFAVDETPRDRVRVLPPPALADYVHHLWFRRWSLPSPRVVEALQGLGEGDLALGLAVEAARTIDDQAQLAALAQVMIDARDARGTLAIGKLAAQRGFSLDAAAFPTFGIPTFEPAANSADSGLDPLM